MIFWLYDTVYETVREPIVDAEDSRQREIRALPVSLVWRQMEASRGLSWGEEAAQMLTGGVMLMLAWMAHSGGWELVQTHSILL
ncbi:hypothetical protein MHYP_G00132300 [Metynnis hypsauchen]